MKRFTRILSIILASVMIAGILVCGAGCAKNPSGNKPKVTNVPSSGNSTPAPGHSPSGDASKEIPVENWGIDATKVVLTINLSGEAHEYTAGELYAMGASIVKVSTSNSLSTAKEMKNYSGITLEKLFAELNIDLGSFAPTSFVIVGANGAEQHLEDRLSEIDLGASIVAFSANNKPIEGMNACLVSVSNAEVARSSIVGEVVSIDIVQ